MKTLFIPAKYNWKVKIDEKILKHLPKNIGLVTTTQFLEQIPEITKQLKGKTVLIGQGNIHKGQILGCDSSSASKIADKVDAFLYIGDGRFHPINVAVQTSKDVFCYNPISNKFSKLDKTTTETYQKRKRGMLLKFHSSDTIGIITSIKPGQQFTKTLNKIKEAFPKKNYYTFISETLDYNQLENFPFIECWVNTACPRIEEDIKILNARDIEI